MEILAQIVALNLVIKHLNFLADDPWAKNGEEGLPDEQFILKTCLKLQINWICGFFYVIEI